MSRHPGMSIAGVIAVLLLMATATLVAASAPEVPRCDGVKLRTGPSTAFTVRAVIGTSTTVAVDTEVSGSAWQSLCAGHLLSGSKWARISAVGGKTVQSQFGVPYLYAAAGLLQALAGASPTAPASTARPPSPSPVPTATPTSPAATEPPSAAPTMPASPSAAPAATQSGGPTASVRPSVAPAGPVTNRTGSSSDPLNGSAATVVLVLAVLSTTLSWFAVADRRRRRARRVAVPDSVPAARLDDVLH